MGERIDEELAQAAQKVAMAASDYLMALHDREFAELNGGTQKILTDLIIAEGEWQAAHPEGDCRDMP